MSYRRLVPRQNPQVIAWSGRNSPHQQQNTIQLGFKDKDFWRLPKALFSSRMPQISYLSYRCDLYILFIFTKTVLLISKTFSKTHYTGFSRCINVYTLFAQPVSTLSTHNKGALAHKGVGTLVLKQQNHYPGWAKPSHLVAGSVRGREADQTTHCPYSEQQLLSECTLHDELKDLQDYLEAQKLCHFLPITNFSFSTPCWPKSFVYRVRA